MLHDQAYFPFVLCRVRPLFNRAIFLAVYLCIIMSLKALNTAVLSRFMLIWHPLWQRREVIEKTENCCRRYWWKCMRLC